MTNFEIRDIYTDLERLDTGLSGIDMDSVKRRTLRRAAESLAEMVRQAVVAEDDIKSPARLISEYEHGPGPSMASRAAWRVIDVGDEFIVRPHPDVEQRAVVLNYGYPGRITPNSADAMRFTINGVPVFAKSVEGPDETHYWRAAMARFRASDKLERFAEEELEDEVGENFRGW